MAVVLLASTQLGSRLSDDPSARRAWGLACLGTAILVVGLIGLTAVKMATTGGDFALDSPLTILVLVVVAAYAWSVLRPWRR